MEIAILIAVLVVGVVIYFNRTSKGLDVNNDGKVDAQDAKAAVQNAAAGIRKAADVDGDGKVTVKDVKAAAAKTKQAVRKAAPRKQGAKKTGAKK